MSRPRAKFGKSLENAARRKAGRDSFDPRHCRDPRRIQCVRAKTRGAGATICPEAESVLRNIAIEKEGGGGGAGGIGGILASTQAGGAAYYHYDFNGNIVQVSGSNQTQLAKYTYGPFGEVLMKEGEFDSRYQFSTKELDGSTGMNYYGYRLYSPSLGRWINRDPLRERGGENLYGYLNNITINSVDYLGLAQDHHSFWGAFAVKVNIDVSYGCDDEPTILQSSATGYELIIVIGMSFDVSANIIDVDDSWGENCCPPTDGKKKKYSYKIDWVLYRSINLGFGIGDISIGGPIDQRRIGFGTISATTSDLCCEDDS